MPSIITKVKGENYVNLPSVGWRAECYNIISVGTCKRASRVVVSVAVSAWARVFEHLRVRRRFTSIGSRVLATATELRLVKCFARAFTRDVISAVNAHNLEFLRTRAVQIHNASRAHAFLAGATLWDHQHRDIVTVDQTHVEEVQPAGTVKGELRQSCRWLRAVSTALDLVGAAISSEAREFSGGVFWTASSAPESATPRCRSGDCFGLAGGKDEACGGKWWNSGVWENSRPNCVITFIYYAESGGKYSCNFIVKNKIQNIEPKRIGKEETENVMKQSWGYLILKFGL